MKLQTWHDGKFTNIKISFHYFLNSTKFLTCQPFCHLYMTLFDIHVPGGRRIWFAKDLERQLRFEFPLSSFPFSSQCSEISSMLQDLPSFPRVIKIMLGITEYKIHWSKKHFTDEGFLVYLFAATQALAGDRFPLGDLCLHRYFLNFY